MPTPSSAPPLYGLLPSTLPVAATSAPPSRGAHAFCLCTERGPLGTAAVSLVESEGGVLSAFLYDVYVREDVRGEGIGRGLVHALLAWAAREGAGLAGLHAHSGEARAFWHALGFLLVDPQADPALMGRSLMAHLPGHSPLPAGRALRSPYRRK